MDSLAVVSIPYHVEERGFLILPRGSEQEFDASCFSSDFPGAYSLYDVVCSRAII